MTPCLVEQWRNCRTSSRRQLTKRKRDDVSSARIADGTAEFSSAMVPIAIIKRRASQLESDRQRAASTKHEASRGDQEVEIECARGARAARAA
jgi:hypothetical protein